MVDLIYAKLKIYFPLFYYEVWTFEIILDYECKNGQNEQIFTY